MGASIKERIYLVDESDQITGTCEKLEAHQKGLLHRAFSIFILDSKGNHLLQKRASEKYHSPGLWTNACCSHHVVGNEFDTYILNRLEYEMGLSQVSLKLIFKTIYQLDCGNDLTEHELDHVFIGITDQKPAPNPSEVSEARYLTAEEVQKDVALNPNQYTPWFRYLFPKVIRLTQL